VAHLRSSGRAEKPDADLPALASSGTEAGRECLAVPVLQLALETYEAIIEAASMAWRNLLAHDHQLRELAHIGQP